MGWLLWTPIIAACAHGTGTTSSRPCQVITTESEVSPCVGKTVTLRGTVTRTKIPTILGVDVEAYGLGDQLAEATGVLEAEVVAPRSPSEPIVADRGPGTYYSLRDGVSLAKARAVR